MRHIKTIPQKYGYRNLMMEVTEHLGKYKPGYDDVAFNEMPYMGIAYVDWDDRKICEKLIFEFEDFSIEDTSLIKLKVLAVTEDKITIAHYDDHHHQIRIRDAKHEDMLVEGNILKTLYRVNETIKLKQR